jgi:hypothetical protein
MRLIMRLSRAVVAGALALGAAGAAAQPKDPDWPCVQRKVQHLSMGMMWAGPIPKDMDAWRADEAIAALAPRLAARRTDLAAVESAVARFAEDADDARVALLFAGIFEVIDRERSRIVDGVTRFARRQQALSARIDAAQTELAEAEAEAGPEDYDALDRIDEMRDALAWDLRIYEERQRSLTYVCESPVILEKRAFAIARIVSAEMEGG